MNFFKEFIREYYLAVGVVFALVLAVLVLPIITEPVSTPQNIAITNVSEEQVTISYITKSGTRDKIFVTDKKDFPNFLSFSKDYLMDDRDLGLKQANLYLIHNITIGDLKSGKLYRYKIYQGVREVKSGVFSTSVISDSVSSPSPVYGRVVTNDKKTPVAGAVVYFQVINRDVMQKVSFTSSNTKTISKDEKSSVLSTITNSEGRWSVDMGNLRKEDLRANFTVGKGAIERIVVDAGGGKRFSAEILPGSDKPWPDVIVNK